MDMTPDSGGMKLVTLFLPFLEELDRRRGVSDLAWSNVTFISAQLLIKVRTKWPNTVCV